MLYGGFSSGKLEQYCSKLFPTIVMYHSIELYNVKMQWCINVIFQLWYNIDMTLKNFCDTDMIVSRDGPNVRLWHSAEAEGLGQLTERVPNVRPNFGRRLYANLSIIPTLSVQCVSYILCLLFALVCLTMFVCVWHAWEASFLLAYLLT